MSLLNTISKTSAAARFRPEHLVSLSVSDLENLEKWTPPLVSAAPGILKFIETHKLTGRLNYAEHGLVARELHAKKTGVQVYGSPYEERVYPKGGTVHYAEKEITLTSRTAEVTKLTNFPVAPAQPVTKPHIANVVTLLSALFDIKKGKLETIRDATMDKHIWGPTSCVFDPAGVPAVKSAMSEALEAYTEGKDIFAEKKTLKGHAMTDFWYTYLNAIKMSEYLALHALMMDQLYRQIQYAQKPDGTMSIKLSQVKIETGGSIPKVEDVIPKTSVKVATQALVPEKDRQEFTGATGKVPFFLAGPVHPRHLWTTRIDTPVRLASDFRRCLTLRGGNKRGIGLLATYADYCPRQSESIRRMNYFAMAIANAPQDRPVQVWVAKGDVSAMSVWLDEKQKGQHKDRYANVKLYIPFSEIKGVKVSGNIVHVANAEATRIEIMDWMDVPDVQSAEKKDGGGEAELLKAVSRMDKSLLGFSHYIVQCPWFHPSQQDKRFTFNVGLGHDLQAIFATDVKSLVGTDGKVWREPIDWKDWAEKARVGMKRINTFMIDPFPIFNDLGTWWVPPKDALQYDAEEGWKIVERTYLLAAPVVSGEVASTWAEEEGLQSSGNSSATVTQTVTTPEPAPPENNEFLDDYDENESVV